jgi:hypothetical protein
MENFSNELFLPRTVTAIKRQGLLMAIEFAWNVTTKENTFLPRQGKLREFHAMRRTEVLI